MKPIKKWRYAALLSAAALPVSTHALMLEGSFTGTVSGNVTDTSNIWGQSIAGESVSGRFIFDPTNAPTDLDSSANVGNYSSTNHWIDMSINMAGYEFDISETILKNNQSFRRHFTNSTITLKNEFTTHYGEVDSARAYQNVDSIIVTEENGAVVNFFERFYTISLNVEDTIQDFLDSDNLGQPFTLTSPQSSHGYFRTIQRNTDQFGASNAFEVMAYFSIDTFTINELTPSNRTPVPEPAGLILFSGGLVGLGWLRRKKPHRESTLHESSPW